MNLQSVVKLIFRPLIPLTLISFVLSITKGAAPEPSGWYSGDIHVHRSCGSSPVPVSTIYNAMIARDLAVISLLADMGNGEVQNPTTDLPKVNGLDDAASTAGRIIHWDTEWHWDATYTQYAHQALGGHLVALGLTSANQVWEESTFKIFDWAHQRNGIAGFAHFQYLDNSIPQTLNCCIPIEYPVEVALGDADFISEDVAGADAAMQAYFRLLNCGLRPGWAGGSDYPCSANIGDVITYAQVSGTLTYAKWIAAIKAGHTVVSRNTHNEFVEFKVNGTSGPGDEIQLATGATLPVTAQWTANQALSGTIEIVYNGQVVASQSASVTASTPATLSANINIPRSGWLTARRMSARGHEVLTAAVFVIVNNAPIRASADDANFYVQWMDNLLQKTSPGGPWNQYFPTGLAAAQGRYQSAKTIYQQIAADASIQPLAVSAAPLPAGAVNLPYSTAVQASGGKSPYAWSLASGTLPSGLTLNSTSGAISGTPTTTGTFNFTAKAMDTSSPVQTATAPLSITINATQSLSIWPASTVPGTLDGGPDSSVELGVKFKSDVAGTITGIRFYKSAGNTGTHTGTLWTSAGAQLATGTFNSESASGWQQLNFITPVTVAANTTYIASYHAPVGHYAQDVNYFATARDNPPLHALSDSAGGGNCVYKYGASTVFPNLAWQAANYWVDVVFVATPPPSLSAIALTPANPSVAGGATQQFTATGTYSDGSTSNLTAQVTWASSLTGVAQINSAGLAAGIAAGSSTISASLSGKTGSTTLTVTPPPLTINTVSFPNGTVNTSYSAALNGSGGTSPYTWSITLGALPTGLTLNPSTGAISGTPTATGTFNFTARVADSSNPQQAITKALGITITTTLSSISVTPGNPTIAMGNTQQFTATGTYSDGTTQNLTTQVTWGSSSTTVAQISSAGLATGNSVGTTTISATLAAISGSTTLTVQPAPLAISTSSLPGGTVNTTYSSTLGATGGTTPRTWSIDTGSLPNGLTLNPSTGAITGTPSTAGTFNLTVRVTDSGTPVQTTAKALSIAISIQPLGLWQVGTVATGANSGPDSSAELGVKFRSDTSGTITGVRFYKITSNTGQHTGSLWSSSGTLLATGTFTGETASGWQVLSFLTPVAINANTVYIASYHANNGNYLQAVSYFSNGLDNPPLHALSDLSGGGNGVYRYGASTVFPNLDWSAANYWVDVLFVPDPPVVAATSPVSGESSVSRSTSVKVTFSLSMTPSTINSTTVSLRDIANTVVPVTVNYASSSRVASITPVNALASGSSYTVVVKGGPSGVADINGAKMTSDYSWSFKTISPDFYAGGPGGSILIVTNAANPFSTYYAEILLNEGLNQFSLKDTSSITAATLAAYDIVVLGQTPLSPGQVTTLTDWVTAGGNLIAMRPDKQLAGLLGITDAGTTLSEGYILVNTASGPGVGIVNQTIQFHGIADRYSLGSASTVATLYSAASASTPNPAVTLRAVGANGGQAAAFTFDLARSICLTRQGNPAWAAQDRDGLAPIRPNDLFYGPAAFDSQPNWVDFNKIAIPQADEQQRLLANMILSMNADKKLLPRFWYFPNGNKAVVVMTGDDHANDGTEGRFDQYLAYSSPSAVVNDWESVRSTSFIYPNTPISDAEAAAYNALGFDISLHLNTGCADYTLSSLNTFFSQQLAQFKTAFPSLPNPTTHRVHCFAWDGYTFLPEVELNYGIRLDVSYYYWPSNWVANRPGLFTGSGMPMRLATSQGNVIDVYEAATQMNDEAAQSYPFTVNTLLDRALGSEGYYGAFVALMHTDVNPYPQSDLIIQSAQSRDVPVISAKQLLTWLDGRNSSSIQSVVWNNNSETFSIQSNAAARGLQVMVPVPTGFNVSTVIFNGTSIPVSTFVVKGLNYAVFDGLTGNYQINFVAGP
jgi:hypothetical protein